MTRLPLTVICEVLRIARRTAYYVARAGVETREPLKQDVWTYSAESVPFHGCGNPVCSIGGIDLRPYVLEAMTEHKETFHIVEVSGSITYKQPEERP